MLFICPRQISAENPTENTTIDGLCQEFEYELITTQKIYENNYNLLRREILEANHLLRKYSGKRKKKFRNALNKKFELEDTFRKNKQMYDVSMIEIRYRKGIDLIKLLYEKILGLEHHFTGMQVYQNVSTLSNPNTYPEFRKAKEMLNQKKHRKFALEMPNLLQSNPFMSATFTLISSFLSNDSKNEKQRDFDEIACVLDFTVRMNGDLNTIRHEVEFLKKANENLKLECERLFEEYTKVVGYLVPLETCRTQDDWENLYEKINAFVGEMQGDGMEEMEGGMEPVPPMFLENSKDHINLEFATRRVSDFIIKYSDFTNRGVQYYQKFDNIISSYENESTCQEVIPRQFSELKFDIKSTIEKFNNTYNLPEIQGSRLKDLMFGLVQR